MVNSHWVWYNSGKPFIPNEDKFGFVYIIIHKKTKKSYIGCKQYCIKRKGKEVESNWKIYTGSNKYLNEEIKKIGKKNYHFKVIGEYKNKRSLKYYIPER